MSQNECVLCPPFLLVYSLLSPLAFSFFFFNDTATTEIYTLSLHDALPISARCWLSRNAPPARESNARLIASPSPSNDTQRTQPVWSMQSDRKSTRLNSSHQIISYAVFCLKKKKITKL